MFRNTFVWLTLAVAGTMVLCLDNAIGRDDTFLSVVAAKLFGDNQTQEDRSVQIHTSKKTSKTSNVASNRTVTSGLATSGLEMSKNCSRVRGQSGRWVQNWTYAAGAQYGAPLSGFNATAGEPYPRFTSWEWKDNSSECQVEQVSLDGFCQVLTRLQVSNVFFVGDSLSHMMGCLSLWGLLGVTDEVPGNHAGTIVRQIPCPVNNHSLNFVFVRNDVILDLPDYSSYPPDVDQPRTSDVVRFRKRHIGPRCDAVGFGHSDYCWPWVSRFANQTGRTLLVANCGAHMGKNMTDYERAFESFVLATQAARRPDDIIVFRTTVPGHINCKTFKEPFQNQSEYDYTQHHFNWQQFPAFNHYAARRVEEMNGNSTDDNEYPWTLLDVVPMTLLRGDGHFYGRADCLHYNTPGPPDWWNHLLFNQLLDMAHIA